MDIPASPAPIVPHRDADGDDPSFTSHSENLPTFENLEGYAELQLQNQKAAADTVPKQNGDAQSGRDNCNIEKTGNNTSNPASKPMYEYELVDDFVFGDKSLIGWFALKRPTLEELSEWAEKNWESELNSTWILKDIGEGFFKFEFFSEDDCEFVLENGPWFMGVAGLSLKRWSPDFDPQNPGRLKTPIWVRLLNLPLKFSDEASIIKICSEVGKVLKVAEPAKKGSITIGTIGRVCVEVDLGEGLPTSLNIQASGKSHKQELYYEGITFR
jgi:hypothetical protein